MIIRDTRGPGGPAALQHITAASVTNEQTNRRTLPSRKATAFAAGINNTNENNIPGFYCASAY